MNDKKRIILDAAMHLFANNGFHLTSMQEIAEHSGVAKGSLYNYFSSKEDLLLSILKHYHELLSKKLDQLEEQTEVPKKQRFLNQISLQLKECTNHKDFILMHMREQVFHNNREISQFMLMMRTESLKWMRNKIIAVYGEESIPYAFDGAIILSGMIREYLITAILDGWKFEADKLAGYLISRLDDIMKGNLESGTVIFSLQDISETPKDCENIIELTQELEHFINNEVIGLTSEDKARAMEVINTLKDIVITGGNTIILQGILLYLEKLNLPNGEMFTKKLKDAVTKTSS